MNDTLGVIMDLMASRIEHLYAVSCTYCFQKTERESAYRTVHLSREGAWVEPQSRNEIPMFTSRAAAIAQIKCATLPTAADGYIPRARIERYVLAIDNVEEIER